MPLLIDGRAAPVKIPFACHQPGCKKTARAEEVPGPKCPDHGVPMRKVRR